MSSHEDFWLAIATVSPLLVLANGPLAHSWREKALRMSADLKPLAADPSGDPLKWVNAHQDLIAIGGGSLAAVPLPIALMVLGNIAGLEDVASLRDVVFWALLLDAVWLVVAAPLMDHD